MRQRYAFFGLPNFVQKVSLDSKAGIPKEYGCDFVSVMPANLYGTGYNYDLQSSHVLPALIRKFHEAKMSGAKEVVLWGTGSPLREFMHADEQKLRLPTAEEFQQLHDRTTHEWCERGGKRGMLFTDKETGKSVFFPLRATGATPVVRSTTLPRTATIGAVRSTVPRTVALCASTPRASAHSATTIVLTASPCAV